MVRHVALAGLLATVAALSADTPTVTFHKEDDYGYEEGFRCCKDADPAP